jgi:hypothetical protein
MGKVKQELWERTQDVFLVEEDKQYWTKKWELRDELELAEFELKVAFSNWLALSERMSENKL